MNRLTGLIILFCVAAAGQGWENLFDGKTLKGWRVETKQQDREKTFWRAVGGMIECDSIGRKDHDYVWLMSEAEFEDFELRAEVRGFAESSGNSGIQFRSRWDAGREWLHGPQADIHPPAPWRSGLIYDETWETRRWIHPSLPDWKIEPALGPKEWKWNAQDWNEIEIRAVGGRVTTKVNGVTITDQDLTAVLDDEAHRRHRVGLKGHFALQLHSRDELKIQYRNIRVRRLR